MLPSGAGDDDVSRHAQRASIREDSNNPMVQLFYGQYLAEGVNEGEGVEILMAGFTVVCVKHLMERVVSGVGPYFMVICLCIKSMFVCAKT